MLYKFTCTMYNQNIILWTCHVEIIFSRPFKYLTLETFELLEKIQLILHVLDCGKTHMFCHLITKSTYVVSVMAILKANKSHRIC